jgi:hypothetical protein
MRGQARAAALTVALFFLLAAGATRAAPPTVSIAPESLPAATVGTAYSQSVTVSGPNPPYTVRVTQGALPLGLSLSPAGAVTGTPTASGSFAFTVSAFTSAGTYVAFRDYLVNVTIVSGSGGGGTPYFADDFEAGLSKWNIWGPTNAFTLVPGWTGQGASLTAGPSTTGPSSSGSEMASLWLNWPAAHAGVGMDTWYAAKVKFPTGYQATTGQWNWFMEWHVDDATSTYSGAYSSALGVYTDYPVTPYPGLNPRLAFRVMGGSVTSPQQYVFTMPSNSLRLGSWYDILVHFVWSPDSNVGLAELWLDGQLLVSTHFPTLYRHPTGATSFNYFGLYNYRPKVSWDASIHFDRVRIGPTRGSVE